MIGQTLNNRYQITSRLGKGAMGTVYHATDTKRGQNVALKIISGELAVDPAMLERFKREGEALSKLKHLNIVGFLDAFQHNEQSVIVMEYVEGGSLYDLLKKGPLAIEHAAQIALDLCDALISSHRLKIIHRDIKPENILIDKDGTPKLADFGVARLSEGTRMTRSGVQVGTPYYMSPEAWEGRTLDAQADIWSLGVVLFEMLSGQVPFGGDTPIAVMTKISTASLPDMRKLRADVPPGLVKIISKMLTRDKRRRYQTMREVAVDLERGQQLTTPVIKPGPKPIDPAEVERRRKRQAARKDALTKNVKAILSAPKLSLNKIPPSFRIAGLFGVAIVLALFFLLQQRPGVLPGGTSAVFSISTSSNAAAFYLYGAANPIIPAGAGNNWDPILSPLGEIYFTSDRDGKAEIYRLNENGDPERVTSTLEPFESWGPAISNLGEVYFTSNRDGKAEIYRLNENGDPERVTSTPDRFESWGPTISNLGEVYFTSNRDGKAEIYRLMGSGGAERVTSTPDRFESWGPVFSSLGEVYFTSDRDGKAEIYRLMENGLPERVTSTPDRFESWGPISFGEDIYFTSNRSTQKEVYRLKLPIQSLLNIESWTNYLDERCPTLQPVITPMFSTHCAIGASSP